MRPDLHSLTGPTTLRLHRRIRARLTGVGHTPVKKSRAMPGSGELGLLL